MGPAGEPTSVEKCAEDEYLDGEGADAGCLPRCEVGESLSLEATESCAHVCSACGVGRFLSDDECVAFTTCEEDEYQTACPAALNDRECEVLTRCIEGQYVAKPPTANTDRSCRSCKNGEFSNTLNAESCTKATGCEEGEYEFALPTATSDSQCSVCEPDTKQCWQGNQQLCSSAGDWTADQICEFVCINGSCGGECVPGTRNCESSTTPRTCDDGGMWRSDAGCGSGAECVGAGECQRTDGEVCSADNQCVSGTCSTYYRDADEDKVGGAAKSVCGKAIPSGYVTTSGDCCDSDAKVFPLQTAYSSAVTKCGGYDYNCDKSDTQQLTVIGSCNGPRACGGSDTDGWSGSVPACGVEGTYLRCLTISLSQSCKGTLSLSEQSCR